MAETARPSVRTFVDTNVFVYSVDDAEPQKRARARELLDGLGSSAVVSVQVLNEFYVVATRRLTVPLTEEQAAGYVDRMSRLPTVALSSSLTTDAIALSRSSIIAFWDALIVHAAVVAGCDRLITEDLGDGQVIAGVRVENPFAEIGTDDAGSEASGPNDPGRHTPDD